MSDTAVLPDPDLCLFLGPNDRAQLVGPCAPPGTGPYVWASIHVAVHVSHGTWTHVYRVLQEGRADRILVRLEKVFEGDREAEARQWGLNRFIEPAVAASARFSVPEAGSP